MLRKFQVTNYKNFKDKLEIDFSKVGGYQFNLDCVSGDVISKMLIYGRNATGKTNLGKAFLDITEVLIGNRGYNWFNSSFLNADSQDNYAEFSYTFDFNSHIVEYVYRKTGENQLIDEKFLIDNQQAFYFNFWSNKGEYDLDILEADTVYINRYLDSVNDLRYGDENETNLSLLRWLINNTAQKEGSLLLTLDDYVKRMNMVTVGAGLHGRVGLNARFHELLGEDDNLQAFEEFLNIMGVECKLALISLPEGQKELYFAHEKPVPFYSNASSGTLALTSLYKRLMIGKNSSFLYVDEFDAFYHYEMSEKVVFFFKEKYPDCQLILTTHNTNLMTNKLMRPDCLFILSRQGQVTALCDATTRELREGHNLEKMYISGEFDAYE